MFELCMLWINQVVRNRNRNPERYKYYYRVVPLDLSFIKKAPLGVFEEWNILWAGNIIS